MFVLYILICLKFIDLIYYLFSISPLYLCSLPSSHFRVFVSLAAILTSYLHLLLFSLYYPIISLYRSISPFPASFISPFPLFNSSLDVNCLLWLLSSLFPSSFPFCVLPHPPTLPSIRIYTSAVCRQEEGRKDTYEKKPKERSDWPSDEAQECQDE